MAISRIVVAATLLGLVTATTAAAVGRDVHASFAANGSYDYPRADPPKPGFVARARTTKPCKTCPWNRQDMGRYPNPFNTKNQYEPIHRGQYFDIYGHWIETRYSEVFWTAQPAIPLPPEIVRKFDGHTISFTGFEVDVVAGGETPDDIPEWSVPEFRVYNHHYCATIHGKGAKMTRVGGRGQDSLLHSSHEDSSSTKNGRHAIEIHPPEWEPRDIGSQPMNSTTIPTAQNFWQGNGGEHRKSFKHLPGGTGQLLWSPQEFILQPMLINTNFPSQDANQTPRQAFYNATMPQNSLSPQGANYSGLLECPCTTRTRKIITGFETRSKDTCGSDGILKDDQECFGAANQLLGGNILSNLTLSDMRYPGGCYLVASSKGTEAFYNSQLQSKAQCGSHHEVPIRSMGSAGVTNGNGHIGIHLDLDEATNKATITLTGPANAWFGIGFNASAMADTPYTLVVEGGANGTVSERVLGNHMPGTQLKPSIQIQSNTVGPAPAPLPVKKNHIGTPIGGKDDSDADVGVDSWQSCQGICQDNPQCHAWTFFPTRFTTPYNIEDGTCRQRRQAATSSSSDADAQGFTTNGWIDGMWSGLCNQKGDDHLVRTVVMTRPLKGLSPSHYTFDPSTSSIPYIEAVGTSTQFGYHGSQGKGGGAIVMVQTGAPICICKGQALSGSINGIPWADNCQPYPATTIRRDNNPSCSIESYQGGMICCHHGIFLLDADQEIPAPTFKFRMKFRFWYEDPEKKVAAVGPSISQLVYPGLDYQNAFFMFRETEIAHGEYDVPACAKGTPPEDCVHIVEGRFQMQDAMRECKGRADVWCSPVAVPNQAYPQSQHVALVHISPHCHGPACISMEMINSDTNETICYTEPHYGVSDNAMDEVGYAAGIPPCLWGSPEEDLPFPPILNLKTNITVIKRVNSTIGHRGVMGHWQMRGIWAADPKESAKGQTNDEEITTR